MCRKTSPKGCRRSRSRASARFRTSRRRTTGTAAIWPSTSGSPSAPAACASPISPAARATARPPWRARRRRSSASTRTPRPTSTPGFGTRGPNLRFERGLVEDYSEPCDAVVFLQTIEHIHDPGALLSRIAEAAPLAYVSTPNRLTLAPEGAEKSENPWHLREYTAAEYRELLEPHFSEVRLFGVFHARKLRMHEVALGLGWDRVHKATRPTKPFYDRFTPAIAASDFALRAESECDLDKALDFLAVLRA